MVERSPKALLGARGLRPRLDLGRPRQGTLVPPLFELLAWAAQARVPRAVLASWAGMLSINCLRASAHRHIVRLPQGCARTAAACMWKGVRIQSVMYVPSWPPASCSLLPASCPMSLSFLKQPVAGRERLHAEATRRARGLWSLAGPGWRAGHWPVRGGCVTSSTGHRSVKKGCGAWFRPSKGCGAVTAHWHRVSGWVVDGGHHFALHQCGAVHVCAVCEAAASRSLCHVGKHCTH